jgi:hypothetical protein
MLMSTQSVRNLRYSELSVGIGSNNRHWPVAAIISHFRTKYTKVTDNRVQYIFNFVPFCSSLRIRKGKLQNDSIKLLKPKTYFMSH